MREVPASLKCRRWRVTDALGGRRIVITVNGFVVPGAEDLGPHDCIAPSSRISPLRKLLSLTVALLSRVAGRARPSVVRRRLEACAACPERTPDGFCGACGCPKWTASRLEVKAAMPGATCPKGLWIKGDWWLTRLLDSLGADSVH